MLGEPSCIYDKSIHAYIIYTLYLHPLSWSELGHLRGTALSIFNRFFVGM